MPEVNPHCVHLSASSIAIFKRCPQAFRLSYREGLRPAADTDSQRMGTNWHSIHETYANTQGDQDAKLAAVVSHLNERYKNVPNSKTAEEWALERQILLVSFHAYWWYWGSDPIEFLVSELPFDLPLHNPTLGLPLPLTDAVRTGKIDHVVTWQGAVCALERKSTSRSIAPDSDYWQTWQKNSQVAMYALAFRDLNTSSLLPFTFESSDRYGNTLVDIYHRPTIKPTTLTQAKTAEFIETGVYFNQEFEVAKEPVFDRQQPTLRVLDVDGVYTPVEEGKKGFAIRETVGMFSARLLADIYERPEFYFARREISRTDADLQHFRHQLWAVYQAQRAFIKGGHWYDNESQCRATFPCAYIPICYGPGAESVCDGKTVPEGFQRIFTPITVNMKEVEE